MTFTDSTDPARANRSCNSVSPTSYGRLPTYNFRPMAMNSSVAIATYPNIGRCRWMSSRGQAELQEERVRKRLDTPEPAQHAARSEPSEYHEAAERSIFDGML